MTDVVSGKDFLFVIEIKNELYYQNQAELRETLKSLPSAVRVYAIIHAGMNTLKVYCITNSHAVYDSIGINTGWKTEILNKGNIK